MKVLLGVSWPPVEVNTENITNSMTGREYEKPPRLNALMKDSFIIIAISDLQID